MTATKPCAVCSRVFPRAPGLSDATWAERRACSLDCGRRLGGGASTPEPAMSAAAAAAILSRPPARIAVRLAQLPACELRLCEWPAQ